jgi:hypothetical protein
MQMNGEVVARMVGDEAILLNLATGIYFTLNAVGAIVWRALETGSSLAAITASVVEEYDIDEVTASADVEALMERLMAEGLVIA